MLVPEAGREGLYELLVSYRTGDMWAPKIEQTEALKKEFSCFYDAIVDGTPIANDGVGKNDNLYRLP